MYKYNQNYNKELNRFNIKLYLSEKKILEHYLNGTEINEGTQMFITPSGTSNLIKGTFKKSTELRELVFVPENEKHSPLEFVQYVANLKGLSYTKTLQLIRNDFKLNLKLNANVELESFSDDRKHAIANGILQGTYNPSKQLPSENQEGVLFLKGVELLGVGGICMLIGQPNYGKSNVSEIICAKFCNPSIDGLGFEFKKPEASNIMYVDMERNERYLYRGWQKLEAKCSDVDPPLDKKVTFLGYKNIANKQPMYNRLTRLERDVLLRKPSILIIDGVAKLIDDINNFNECVEFNRWLCNLTEEYNLAVFITIHANPSDMKAQGHLGSVLMREAESVLALKYDKSKGSTQRCITTNFQHGKVRGDSDKVEAWIEWGIEQNCFVSSEKKPSSSDASPAETLKQNVIKAFEGKERLTYKELGNQMAKVTANTYETERKKISKLVELEYITFSNSLYELHPSLK